MPTESDRKTCIKRLKTVYAATYVLCDSDESSDEECEVYLHCLASVMGKRYLSPRQSIPKCDEFHRFLFNLDSDRFRQEFRVPKETFHMLVELLEENEVFQNAIGHPQTRVEHQLLIVLSRMGEYGSAASVGKTARKFGIGEGTVLLFTQRVISAIIDHKDR